MLLKISKKGIAFLLILITIVSIIPVTNTLAGVNDDWDVNKLTTALNDVKAEWSGAGYIVPPYTVQLITGGSYGKNVSSESEVTNVLDYIARTIFGEVISGKPRLDNAFAVAQTIKNRMAARNQDALTVCSSGEYQAAKETASISPFKRPSHSNYNIEWSEPSLSKEKLFIECMFLAYYVYYGSTFPTTVLGYTNIGNRQYFTADSATDTYSKYFFTDSACTSPCLVGSYANAKYHKDGKGVIDKIQTSVITIGRVGYYNR